MINNIFGSQESTLKLSAYRSELLANNIANADTPNFKARDIDFKEALASAKSNQNGVLNSPEEKYRLPLQPSLDGNTVEVQIEQAKFAENSLQYQASLNSINSTIRTIRSALSKE